MRTIGKLLCCGMATGAMLAAGGAYAQDATRVATTTPAEGPVAPQTTEANGAIADVVVTAQRRSENLQNVPVSVGVVGGADLRAFQAGGDDTLLSLSGRVPGLYAETTTGRIFPRFYIRGLGNIDFYLGASQPVTIIQDDVVLEHVVLKSNPVYDVGQVEVLRGPQGSLFGRNTTAGIIKFDTLRPTQDFEARGTASYGSFNTATFDGGVGGPIVADKIAFRLSGLVQHRDNYVDNVYAGPSADGSPVPQKHAMGGFNERDIRLQFLLTPTENLSILASGHGRDYVGTSTLFLRGALTRGSNQSSASRTQVAFDEGGDNPQHYHTYGGSLNVGYDMGFASLTSITALETTHGFSRGDTDGGAAANFPVNGVANGYGQSQGQIRYLDQWTQEVRLASPGHRRFTYQVGGIYFSNVDLTEFDQRAYFLTTAARNPNNFVLLRDVNTSWAVFGQASLELLPRLTLTVGGRETKDTKRTALLQTANTAAGVSTYGGRRYVRLSDTQPSWDASVLYQATPELSVYARAARGFRGPTIQGRSAVFNSDFTTASSEKNTSFEAGFKSVMFDGKLRLNATAFAYTVRDIQLNGNDVNGNGVLFNADHANGYGMEGDAEIRPFRNLTLTLGYSALRTEIRDKRVYAQVCALNGQVVCTVMDPTIRIGTNTFAQIDGEPLPNAPRFNFNATARYDMPLNDRTKLFVATDWNVQGYTQFVLYRTAEFNSNGNFEGGVKAGVTLADGRYEVAAFARNVTNERNLKGVIENYLAAVYNDPRIIGVSLSGRFR